MAPRSLVIPRPAIFHPLRVSLLVLAVGLLGVPEFRAASDPLPSWNDGAARRAIVEFVEATTKASGPDFVPPAERIAVFDNDGTLWVEHPIYTQLAFELERVKALAPEHPEWTTTQPFQAALENDLAALGAAGERGIAELVMATHAGMTTADVEPIVKDWPAPAGG
jgi:hypothetical protein